MKSHRFWYILVLSCLLAILLVGVVLAQEPTLSADVIRTFEHSSRMNFGDPDYQPPNPNPLSPDNNWERPDEPPVSAPLPTPTPVWSDPSPAYLPITTSQPNAFPWQPAEIVYDGPQLCSEQENPDIAVDVAGNAYAVWADCRNLDEDNNWDIYFSYRPVGGVWGTNQRINDDVGTAEQRSPSIAVDSAGNTYVVWQDRRNNNEPNNWDIYFTSRPVGGSWSTNQRVDDAPIGYVEQLSPSVAADDAGNVYAVWSDVRNGNADIYFASRSAGAAWSVSQRINDDAGNASQYEPDITVSSDGSAYIVWYDYRNGNSDIFFTYRPATGSWAANQRVNDDTGSAQQFAPVISIDEAGTAYAVWQDQRNGFAAIYFSFRPTGGSWVPNERVDDAPLSISPREPSIAVDGSGNAHVLWYDERQTNYDIQYALRPANGLWSASQRVNDDPLYAWQYSPAIVVDENGNAYAVWEDKRNGNWDIYFAYKAVGANWDANQRVDDSLGAHAQDSPAIAVNAAGNAYALWEDERNVAGDANTDAYFAYRPVDGAWGGNERVNDDPGSGWQSNLDIAVDMSGNAYATWSGNAAVYFAYRPYGGAWGANERVDNAPFVHQRYPSVGVDNSGNAHVVWQGYDFQSNRYNIYYVGRSAGGNWSSREVINDAPSSTTYDSIPVIAVDPDSNAYVSWTDERNGNADIYFASRPAGGSWSASQQVDANSAGQNSPAIAVGTDSTVYMAWTDLRNGNSDIYFAYLPAGGSWSASQPVEVNAASQSDPSLAVDANGNAYVVWTDLRNGSSHIYFAYRPSGGDWTASQRVNDYPASQRSPDIAVDAQGNAYVVWQDTRHLISHIFFSHASHEDIANDPPSTVTVNTTIDIADGNTASIADLIINPGQDGVISLREALLAANNMSGPKTITFSIPTGDPGFNATSHVWTIQPTSPLPSLTSGQIGLDASTQGVSSFGGPSVELNGTNANGVGIAISSANNELRGFVINRFAGVGVYLGGADATENVVAGNYIGTDASGSMAQANSQHGIVLQWGASYNRIGGTDPADRNVISGNNWHGIEHWGDGTSFNVIQGNRIGTDVTGLLPVGNRGKGISVTPSAHDTLIGGDEPGAGNVIAFNGTNTWDPGVGVGGQADVRNNQITRNSIYANVGKGIQIDITANNGIQPPQITAFGPNNLAGATCANCTVDIFSDADDEGRYYEGTVLAGPDGQWSWSGTPTLPRLTATATDSTGNTSEFSQVAVFIPNDPWSANERVDDGLRGCDQYNPTTVMGSDGTIYAAWEECRNGHGDIYFARSSNNGATWSIPVRVNDDLGRIWQYDPAMALSSDGTLYLVWEDRRQNGQSIYFAYSGDDGATWSQNQSITPNWAYRYDPAIALDTSGRIYVTWYEESGSNSTDIYAVTSGDAGANWSSPQRVTDDVSTNSYQYRPAIVSASPGVVHVAWEDRRGGSYQIFAAATSDNGATWSVNRRVDDDLGPHPKYMATLAVTPNGNVHAAWYDYRNGNVDIFTSLSSDGGLTWGTNVRVDDDPGTDHQTYPVLLATEEGSLWAAWQDFRGGSQVRMTFSSDNGNSWAASARVDDNPGSGVVTQPVLAGRGGSQLAVLWLDNRSGAYDLRAASSSDNGAAWSASSQVNQDDTGQARQSNVRLAVDALGNALAIWTDTGGYSGSTLYAAAWPAGAQMASAVHIGPWSDNVRLDATSNSQYWPDLLTGGDENWYALWSSYQSSIRAARSNDNGATWTPSVLVSDSGGTGKLYPHLAMDSAGALYAVWWDARSGNNLYLASSTNQGQTWSPNLPIPPASGLSSGSIVDLAAGDPGELYLVWQQSSDIWFSASSDGGATWSAAQRVNDNAAGTYRYGPSVDLAPGGVVHVAWYDYRNGNADIYYAQRNPAGDWGPNLRVNDDSGTAYQYAPDLAVDQAGNAHLVWYDYRNGDGDIYYAYRPAGGVWSANGKVDDAVLSSQSNPRVAVDGAGNAYAIWIDERAGPSHPYFAWLQYADLPQRTPAPQITFPMPGATNQSSLEVRGLACAECQVNLYDGNTLLSTVAAAANGVFSSTVNLTAGSHALTAVAQHTATSAARLAPATWLPSLPSATVPLAVDSSLRIDPQRLTLAYTMWGGQTVVLRPRNATGLLVSCAGEVTIPGFQIRPDLPNTLTVAVSGSPTHVQVVIAGVGVFDLTPLAGDLWQTTFTVSSTHNLTIRISDDGAATFANQCTGQVLIDPQGVISDAATSLPIQGATVTCYVATEGGEWARWPAEDFDGQTNPQFTAADGFYAFFTPPGSYQVEAWAPGYVPHRSETIVVTSQLVEVNLALQPQSIPCPADLDGDGQVSISDIVAIAEKWNAVSPNYPYAPGFDLMPVGAPDGAITIADIQYVAGQWGEICAP